MTKEEKDRKFLFDLAMGVFNVHDDKYVIFYDFNENILDVMNILKFNGYTEILYYPANDNRYMHYINSQSEYSEFKSVLEINMYKKSFKLVKPDQIFSFRDLKTIEVPDYIKDYVTSYNFKKYVIGDFYI